MQLTAEPIGPVSIHLEVGWRRPSQTSGDSVSWSVVRVFLERSDVLLWDTACQDLTDSVRFFPEKIDLEPGPQSMEPITVSVISVKVT